MDSTRPPPSTPPQQRYPNWVELPREVTASILRRVAMIDILNTVELVCTTWRSVCKDPSMWRSINIKDWGYAWLYSKAEKMCQIAVDRSCGGLTDINIEYYGTDDLLCYIADRSPQLKRLRIVYCYSISDKGLSKAVRKLPLLEELAVFCCQNVTKETLEVVAQSCPLLRSLKFNREGYKRQHMVSDEEALAIAKNMPHLRHLEIIGNKLTNEGLQAILDGCSHLESLDLRLCFNISLDGELEKKCAAQIKDLRRPNDPLTDYPFIPNGDSSSDSEDYNYYNDFLDEFDPTDDEGDQFDEAAFIDYYTL